MVGIRKILHIDLNSFYASVEAVRNPNLKNRAMAVAGSEDNRGGVILTASYEAREYGVKAGMSNREALYRCPNIILVPPRMKLYREYSKKVMDILRKYTYKVEQFSIDEAWVDITDLMENYNTPKEIAFEIKEEIKRELGITVSVGLSYNKILAKLASDIANRDSLYEITPKLLRSEIWEREVKEIMGVGKKTRERLESMNILTIGDLACSDKKLLKAVLGKNGINLWNYANGIDNSEVDYLESFPKSIGNSHTTIEDVKDIESAKKMLYIISEQVGRRIRNYNATASVVSITVKTNDFESYTRQRKLNGSITTTNKIYEEACKLLIENWDERTPIRLLGISLMGLSYYEQQLSFLSLIDECEIRDENIDKAMDIINNKYQKHIVTRALILEETNRYLNREKD